jgi:hypothetical protein
MAAAMVIERLLRWKVGKLKCQKLENAATASERMMHYEMLSPDLHCQKKERGTYDDSRRRR